MLHMCLIKCDAKCIYIIVICRPETEMVNFEEKYNFIRS